MLSKTFSSAVYGIDAFLITIEVRIGGGLNFYMVGLPDNAVKESQQRVESAIKSSGFWFPRTKVIVNLAPADLKKEGSVYDLPIALGVLEATGQVQLPELSQYIIMGELSLYGDIRPVKGVLPVAIEARDQGFKGIIVPEENASEAAIVNDLDVIGVNYFSEAVGFFKGEKDIKPLKKDTRHVFYENLNNYGLDFADVQGQENIKRALEIAAAGGHNVIMVGPPGSGKTMLAKRLPSILPPLSLHEALETTKIHSVAGKLDRSASLVTTRPFQSPHHTVSDVALVGGGNIPKPGQISLAHNGILFLDELPEFKRTVLEVMRQPLEERQVTISRARATISFPANFMLVASMNPSPSGDFYDPDSAHPDSPASVQKYLNKISGPLLDRIDMHLEVNPVPFDEMTANRRMESSADIRERVIRAREIQSERFKAYQEDFGGLLYSNSMMDTAQVKKVCPVDKASSTLLKTAMERLGLSARAYDRILKVARTIADLGGEADISAEHIAEAIQYRALDRQGWLA